MKVAQLCLTLQTHGLYSPWNSPGQNTRVGCHSLLQGIFPTQGSNPGLPYCRWILHQLSHKGRLNNCILSICSPPLKMKSFIYIKTHIQLFIAFICSSQKLETNKMSYNRWMIKQTVVYSHHGTLLSNEKEPTPNTCNNLDRSQRHYAEWKSQFQKVKYCMIPFI